MKRSRGPESENEPAPKRLERELRSLVIDPKVQTQRQEEQQEEEIQEEPTLIIDPKYLQIPLFVLQDKDSSQSSQSTKKKESQNQLVVYQPPLDDDDTMHLSD